MIIVTEYFLHNLSKFCAKLAIFQHDFLHDAVAESTTSCAQMKAENERILKLSRLLSIGATKPELWAFEDKRAFFLGHPVLCKTLA